MKIRNDVSGILLFFKVLLRMRLSQFLGRMTLLQGRCVDRLSHAMLILDAGAADERDDRDHR